MQGDKIVTGQLSSYCRYRDRMLAGLKGKAKVE
jgi:hypothetical protein